MSSAGDQDGIERPLTVLLVSPVGARDVHSGDVTYTAELLATPPPGVRYVTYDHALEAGTLVELGRWRGASGRPRTPGDMAIAGAAKAEAIVRRSGVVFREPLRHFRVAPGAFDLVHAHVFHTAFHGAHPPVVTSAGAPLVWLYRDAWGWRPTRLRVATAFDRVVARSTGASMCTHHGGQARRFVSPSLFLRDWLIEQGWPADRVDVVPNYCADPQVDLQPGGVGRGRSRAEQPTIGFVAKDFDAKGGDLVVQAHSRLRSRYPDLRLVIIGSPPRLSDSDLAARGISWTSFVPRQQVLNEVLAGLDVLAHPSGVDALLYSVMEALARGIPALVSDHTSLPEMVEDGAGVAVPRTVDAVTDGLAHLLSSTVWTQASVAARALFERRFSARTQAPALARAYRAALGESRAQ